MSYPWKILFQVFVKSFYKENAGIFIFIFTMMFFIVSQQSGAGLFEYHYSLLTGMLSSIGFLSFVFFIWLIYARKCVAHVFNVFHKPENNFIYIFNCLSKLKRFKLFFLVEIWLMIPVLLYTCFIISTGLQQHFYIPLLFVTGYLILLCIVPALWYVDFLNNLQQTRLLKTMKVIEGLGFSKLYEVVLLRYIANKQKMMWFGLKTFTCGILYLMFQNNFSEESDINFVFLFFNFGILANGIIVYRIREFEELYLSFYRGLPISLLKRFLEYSVFYFIILIPEFITAIILVPKHLQFTNAIQFALSGYSLLLLMNSITFLHDINMKDFLKILLIILCVQFVFLMTVGLTFLYLLLFILAIAFFLIGYYKSERVRLLK